MLYSVTINDHLLTLNLLILGMATDSNCFPTELAVELVYNTVSTFPVNTFSFPILNSTQLSFLVSFSILRAGLLEVKIGESQVEPVLTWVISGLLILSATDCYCSISSANDDEK